MLPALLDVGWLGSAVDVATFIVVVMTYVHEVRPRVDKTAAGVVALAHQVRGVDADRLASDLDVEDRDIRALEPTVIRDGREQS